MGGGGGKEEVLQFVFNIIHRSGRAAKLLLFLRSVRAISATSSSIPLTIGSLPEGKRVGENGSGHGVRWGGRH